MNSGLKKKLLVLWVKFRCLFILNSLARKEFRRKYFPFGWKERKIFDHYGERKIHDKSDRPALILEKLSENKPCLVARMGSGELGILEHYIRNPNIRHFPKGPARGISVCCGFFPNDDAHLLEFCKVYSEALKQVDIMGVWFNNYEREAVDKYCPKAELCTLESMDFVHGAEGFWGKYLKGKKVLVIHPFEESIRSQYARREKLFPGNSDILPEFELKTIKAVQSLADNKDTLPFKTWFEALKSMTDQIDKTDFDIAIIGAGAYGLPLGAHCKRIGKQAIHLGGATQLLFGIMGRRWENYNSFTDKYVNEYWIRPSESERPKGAEKVEGACYF